MNFLEAWHAPQIHLSRFVFQTACEWSRCARFMQLSRDTIICHMTFPIPEVVPLMAICLADSDLTGSTFNNAAARVRKRRKNKSSRLLVRSDTHVL